MPGYKQEYVNRFWQECFEIENAHYQKQLLKNASENAKAYIEQMRNIIKQFFLQIEKMQILVTMPVSCVEISILRSSVYSDTLKVCLEAFDMDGHSGSPVLSTIIEIDWFQDEWKELIENLEVKRKQTEWARYVKPEDIMIMLQDTIHDNTVGLYFFFKYVFEDVKEWKEYANIIHTDFFFLSMGEYHDWQRNLFVDRPEFDIFMADMNNSLRYGSFSQVIYKGKDFTKMDLKGSVFEDCKFVECEFRDTNLMDCKFINCEFVLCGDMDVNFSGSLFQRSSFRKCNLKNVVWFQNPVFPVEKFEDLYRRTKIFDCDIYNCVCFEEKMGECDIRGTQIRNDLEE